MNPDQVKLWLQSAPAEPAPTPPGFVGFYTDSFFYCAHCTGRLLNLGIYMPPNAVSVYSDELRGSRIKCDACTRLVR